MSTYEDINAIIDGMKSRIETSITSLGGTAGTLVIEGDELPAHIRSFPSFYIIPLISGGDHITTKMSDTPRFHELKVTIAGAYKGATVTSLLRTTRNYGYVAADLFSVTNQAVSGIYYNIEGEVDTSKSTKAYCINPVVNVGYHQVKDYLVHTWIVDFTVKIVTG